MSLYIFWLLSVRIRPLPLQQPWRILLTVSHEAKEINDIITLYVYCMGYCISPQNKMMTCGVGVCWIYHTSCNAHTREILWFKKHFYLMWVFVKTMAWRQDICNHYADQRASVYIRWCCNATFVMKHPNCILKVTNNIIYLNVEIICIGYLSMGFPWRGCCFILVLS